MAEPVGHAGLSCLGLRLICPENLDLAEAFEGLPSLRTSFSGGSASTCSALRQGTNRENTDQPYSQGAQV